MKISIPSRVGPLTKIAMPCFVEQLLLVVVNVLSTMIVGQLGKAELSASSMSNQLVNWLQCAYVGLGSGATVVIGRMWGKGDREGAARGFMQSLKLTVLVSITVLILTVVFENAIVSLFFGGAEQAVIDNIHTYFFYCMIGMPATAIANVIGASLRGVGDNKTPLYTTAVLNVVNLVLSFLLIFGVPALGIPRMGIAGAAIATVAGQIVAAFVVMKRGFRRSPAKRLYPKLAGEIFRLGLPNILMQSAYTFYIFGLNLILSGFFSGSRRRAEKFSADGSTYSGSVCTAGLSFLPIRPELVLADLSCHRGNYHCGRSRILQKFSGSSLCQECADAG